jgi:hypothetical protein
MKRPGEVMSAAQRNAQLNNDDFIMSSVFLNNYNEIHGTNTYLQSVGSVERQKLESMLDRLRSVLLKMKYDYMLKKRTIEEYKTRITILQTLIMSISSILILVILFYQNKLGVQLLSTIIAVVIIVFVLIVVLLTRANTYRTETDWNKFYWGPMKEGQA